MTTISQALDRMRAAASAPITNEFLTASSDQLLRPLIRGVEELEAAARTDWKPSRSSRESAVRAWELSDGRVGALTTQQVGVLCWDPDRATDPRFVSGLASVPELGERRRSIEGLIASYLARWRTMEQPDALERLLQRAVHGFHGRSARISMYEAAGPKVFSGSAPQWLAESIVWERQAIDATLNHWRIEQASALAQATANASVAEWTRRFAARRHGLSASAVDDLFNQLTEDLLSSTLIPPTALASAMSAMILCDQVESDERLRDRVRGYLLADRRFGDPRLPNRPIWDLCEPAARQRAVGWLAREDLIFFFQFVIESDPHGRRDFWLRYIENATDAYVALSADDERRLRAQVKDRPRHARVVAGNTSAFLMRFPGRPIDLLCVEFSTTGNALYVYDAHEFINRNKSIREGTFNLNSQLKHSTAITRVSHMTNWRRNVQDLLARYGVRPT